MAHTNVHQIYRTYHSQPTEGPHKGQWIPSGSKCPASPPVTGASKADLEALKEQAQVDFAHKQRTTGEPDAEFEIRTIWPAIPEKWDH